MRIRYVSKMRESFVYVDNISLCVERKSRESMLGVIVDKIEKKTLLQVLIGNK